MLFEVTQAVYFLVNLVLGSLSLRRANVVNEDTTATDRDLAVLIAASRENEPVLRQTLRSVEAADYPEENVTVYLIHEMDDQQVLDAIHGLRSEFAFETVPVDMDDEATWRRIRERWLPYRGSYPPTKARALTYALTVLDLSDDVVTVLDADTLIPADLFASGVGGLQEYDVVQAKQTARNRNDGLLAFLEAMGMAGWSDAVYGHTAASGVPYQLLGKGYFLDGATLEGLDGWDPNATTEDMDLGVRAYKAGLTLGVVDVFVQDLCPVRIDHWIGQKRRWLAGPYDHLLDRELTWSERLRFASYALVPQVLPVTNVVGIPAGMLELYLVLVGAADPVHPVLGVIVVLNGVNWLVYTYRQLRATARAVTFERLDEKLAYYLVSNPVTQVFYATLWAVPLALALTDWFRDERTFEVTPKEVTDAD